MKSVPFFALLLACSAILAQSPRQTASKKIDTVYSAVLKEKRIVWIHLPAQLSAKKKYPVIYILDAEVLFNPLVENLSKAGLLDKVIVAGIGNMWNRYRDYSPTRMTSSPYVDSFTIKTTGGGKAFISFIEKELIPYVNSSYPTSSTRTLIGHSMGGLIVVDILLKHTKLFNYYAAIDPSLWWDNEKLLTEAKSILTTKKFEGNSLFLAAANTRSKDMTFEQLKTGKSDESLLIRPTLTFADYINATKQNKLKFDWKYYNNENHMSVFPPASYDAIRFIAGFLNHQ